MYKITNLYDVLSRITNPEPLGPDYYFYKTEYSDMKSWKDDVLFVAEGFSSSNIFESK